MSCCLPCWRDCPLQRTILPVFGSQAWIPGLFWSQQSKTRQGFRPNSSLWLIGAQGKSSWIMLAGFGLWLRSSLTWQMDGMKHHRRMWSLSQPKQKPSLLPRPLKEASDLLFLCWARHLGCPKTFYQHWRTNKMGSESLYWWVHRYMMESAKEVHWIKGFFYLFYTIVL